jgi:hypothetical protein
VSVRVLPCDSGTWAMNRMDRRFVEMAEIKLIRNVPTAIKIFLNEIKEFKKNQR